MKPRPVVARSTGAHTYLGVLLAAFCLLVFPAAAPAAPGWTESTDIGDTASVSGLDVAVDRDGDAILVGSWLGKVGAAVRAPSGEWSAPEELAGSGSSPDLAFAPDGTATAVWVQTGTEKEVWTSSRDTSGAWSEPERLSSADASAQNPRPAIVIDRAGNSTAVWVQNCAIYSARRPANGAWLAPTEIWTDPTAADPSECPLYSLEPGFGVSFAQAVFDVGVDAAGNVTAVWRSGGILPGAEKTIRTAVRPAGGSSVWTEDRVVGPATLNQRAPRIEVWDDGRAIVTWGIDDSGARAAVRPAGADQPFGTPVTLSATGSPDPTVAYDGHGNATVAWQAPPTAEDPATLQVAKLDRAGGWGPATPATSFEAGTQPFNPRLVVSQGGDAILAWALETGVNEFGEYEIELQTVRRPVGGDWEAVATLGTEQSGEALPALAGDALGNATVAWGGDGTWMGFPATVARTADFAATPALRADWTANGLVGAGNFRSWVDYLYNGGGGVEASAGATRPDANDRYSYRLNTVDAWIEQSTGETVAQLQGTIRFSYPGHHIDIRIVDPQIRVAADGKSARLLSDGQGSGDMGEAIKGNPQVELFGDLHLLNLSLPSRIVSRDGEVQSWIAAAAKIAPGDGARILSYSAGTPYGFFTFSAPANLPTRDTRPVDPGPGPGDNPAPPSTGTTTPPPAAPSVAVKPKKCGKGKRKVKVKGKRKCVKAKKGKGAQKGKGR